MKYSTVMMIENRMIFLQLMSAIAKLCKGDKDLEHQSVMWIKQQIHNEMIPIASYVLNLLFYITKKNMCIPYVL